MEIKHYHKILLQWNPLDKPFHNLHNKGKNFGIKAKFWPHYILNSCSKSGQGLKCLIERFHCVHTTTVWHEMLTKKSTNFTTSIDEFQC